MPLRELKKLAGEMDLPNKSQWEAIPLSRIVELREMIVLHCARRHEDRVVIQISDMRHRHRKSTPAFKVLEPGTLKVDINQVNDHLLITRDVLKNWIVVALRNQYVTVGGKVKRQTRGLAQGKADAVRLSALVLSFYEMTFVLRCCHRWTAEKMPQGVRMMCLHSQRMVDDLWQIVPKDFDNFELLYFNSFAPLGTFQGVYPTAAPNQSERDVIMNPIVFSTDNTGVSVPHLDFTTMIHPDGRLEWKLFDKVWAIPELCRIRKFPHRFTFLSARVMRNTVWCALRRADARTSSLNYLTKAIKDDLQLRLFHEWEPLSLKRLILQFTQYSPSKGKAHVVAAAIRKTVNETIGEFEKSKSIVK